MKLFSAFLVATSIAALAQPVSAKSIWEQLAESAPRAEHPFDQIEMTAPRSNVFTELEQEPLVPTCSTRSKIAP